MNENKPLAIIYFLSIPISLAAILSALMASSDPNQSPSLEIFRVIILAGWVTGPVILFKSASNLLAGNSKKFHAFNMEITDQTLPIYYLAVVVFLTLFIGIMGEIQ